MPPVIAPPEPPAVSTAAPPPPPPPPQKSDPPPISSITKKPISEAAHNLFRMLDQSNRPEEERTAPEPDKPEVSAAPAPVAAAPAPEPPVRVSRAKLKRPELPSVTPPAPPSVAAAPAAPDANWEESLIDDERTALEDARFAEQVNVKHKGLAERMGKFFREQKKYLEAHPDATDDDPEYKRILAQSPVLSGADRREITEARIEGRVAKRYDTKIADLDHELYVRDESPKVEAEAAQIRRHMAFNALPAEMLTVLKEKGLPMLQKEYADELEIAGGLINTLTEDAAELLRIARLNPKTNRTLSAVAAEPTHPKWDQHNRIATMVNAVCEDFQKTAPATEQVRDGKWFVTRDEWGRLPAGNRQQYWTFTNSDAHVREMINRAMGWMPGAIAGALKTRQEELKRRGYVRQREAAPAAPAVPPVPSSGVSPPRPAPAPVPSPGSGAPPTQGSLIAKRLAAPTE